MNAAGEVVGSFIDQFGTHGFLYAQGSFTNFDAPNTLPTRGTFARDVNDAGQILVKGSGNFLAIAAPASPVVSVSAGCLRNGSPRAQRQDFSSIQKRMPQTEAPLISMC